MIQKCKELIDELQYARISEERGLQPTCPILDRCERRIKTIYAYSYQGTDTPYDEKIKIIEKLNKMYISNDDQINMIGNEAYSCKHINFFNYKYMCPEVNLFDGNNRLIDGIAVSAFEWDKYSDHREIIITECKHYSDCLEYKKYQHEIKLESGNLKNLSDTFVNKDRINDLIKIKSDFDLTKLIRICEELNSNYSCENYLSVSILGRVLLDHIPPIFKFNNFNEVANNYGTKSFKKSMQHLQGSLRNIADGHLHSPIRKKESLPNKTQVDFRTDLDVLLAEIIRFLD
jgi:hypothetical protein